MGETTFPPFTVTRSAVEAIEAFGGAVRIDVIPGGCSGTTYGFQLAPDEVDDDATLRYGCPGAWLLVTERASAVMEGATLDYGATLKPPRFRVTCNPNVEEVCACRRSFGEPWPGPGQPECRSYLPMPWDKSYVPPERWQRQTGYSRDD